MKTTLTALSLMLVLGSISAVQAAPTVSHDTAQHRTTVSRDVSVTRDTVVSPAIEGDFAATHTVNTHLGTFGVDANRVDHERPQGKAQFCSMTEPTGC